MAKYSKQQSAIGNRKSEIRYAFTLIELLVVIGVMAVLTLIALPAFEKLAKGSGVEYTARNVSSKLGMARGYAITSRQYIAVLMPCATLPNNYRFTAYRMCEVSKSATNAFTFKRWLPNESWTFSSTGTAISGVDNALGTDAAHPSAADHEEVNGVNCSDITTGLTANNVPAIVFKPSGKISIGSTTSDRYVTVSEATFDGTNLKDTSQNKNFIDIIIDQYTGRVTYGGE